MRWIEPKVPELAKALDPTIFNYDVVDGNVTSVTIKTSKGLVRVTGHKYYNSCVGVQIPEPEKFVPIWIVKGTHELTGKFMRRFSSEAKAQDFHDSCTSEGSQITVEPIVKQDVSEEEAAALES